MNYRAVVLTFATCFLVANAQTAHGELILIDWSRASTVSAPAGDGMFWNSIGSLNGGGSNDNVSVSDLVTSTNLGTAIDVDVDFGDALPNNGFGGTGVNGPAGADPFDEAAAIIDGIFSDKGIGVVSITFSDLDPLSSYDFSAIGGRSSNGADGLISVTQGTGSAGTLLNDGTILNFSVQSDASGVIAFNFNEIEASPDGPSATFNALSITTAAVPEPNSAILLAVGGLAVTYSRRRRRSAGTTEE